MRRHEPKTIALATLGTWGDLQPFVHLAAGLRQAGHRVRILTQPEHTEQVHAECGVTIDPITSPIDPALVEQLHRRVIEDRNPLGQLLTIFKYLCARDASLQRSASHQALADCDLVVAHATAMVSQEAARAQGLPVLGVALAPGILRHPGHPPMDLPDLGTANRILWHLVTRLGDHALGIRMRRLIPSVAGHHLQRTSDCFGTHGVLVAASPALAPGVRHRAFAWTGHWHRPPDTTQTLPTQVQHFLQAGPPPLYVGFGSMEPGGGHALGALCAAAARQAGVRLILQRGWADLQASGDDICVVDHLPHDLLLPHCLALVHHCGAGTTHAAARSGRPSIPVPFLADQPYWAACLRRRCAATAPIPRTRLTSQRLAAAITRCQHDQHLRTGAAQLATACATHNGIHHAVRIIEAVAERHREQKR